MKHSEPMSLLPTVIGHLLVLPTSSLLFQEEVFKCYFLHLVLHWLCQPVPALSGQIQKSLATAKKACNGAVEVAIPECHRSPLPHPLGYLAVSKASDSWYVLCF